MQSTIFSMKVVVQTLRNASKGGGGKQSMTTPSLLYKNAQKRDIGGGVKIREFSVTYV